jgi:hypothetical protein
MSLSASKGNSVYLALIGDVRRSREHADRPALQRQLEQSIEIVNTTLGSALASRFVITLGDEFQGLLSEPEAALNAILAIDAEHKTARLRYALGWGTLSTPLRVTAIGMDGPCFHRARDAMTLAKQRDRWVTVAGFGEEADAILNGVLSLIGAVRATWTPIQAETAAIMHDLNVQKEVAAARGVALPTVHKALRGALYGSITEAEEAVRRILRSVPRTAAGEVARHPSRGTPQDSSRHAVALKPHLKRKS